MRPSRVSRISTLEVCMSTSNEDRPPTKLDRKTLVIIVAVSGGLILLIALNMK